MNSICKSFLQEEDGQDLIEYSLLLAFVALVAVATLPSIQGSLTAIFDNLKTAMSKAKTASAGK